MWNNISLENNYSNKYIQISKKENDNKSFIMKQILKKNGLEDSFDYSIDNGKISLTDKIKNIGEGIISPITNIFSSPKNFLLSAGTIIAGGALIAVTGGAAAPILIAFGVTGGTIQLWTNIYKASTAKTDAEAEAAWQGIGAGSTSVAMSVVGSKSALKVSGTDTANMGFIKSTIECFKNLPENTKTCFNAFFPKQTITALETNAISSLKETQNIHNTTKIEEIPQKTTSLIKAEGTVDLPDGTPEYLYHMTSTENYGQIIESGSIKMSAIETGPNSCKGTYMISKDNFKNNWIGTKEPEIFGDIDIGEILLQYTGAMEESMTAIKIPTSSLDLSKLRFRPYIEACKAAIESLDDTNIVHNSIVTDGLPLNELPNYINKVPVEFIYQGEIPASIIVDAPSSGGILNCGISEIISNLFGKD